MQSEHHHVIPKSRCTEFHISRNNPDNIILVEKELHSLYHSLFSNKIPEEIIDLLNKHFWGNKYEITVHKRGQ